MTEPHKHSCGSCASPFHLDLRLLFFLYVAVNGSGDMLWPVYFTSQPPFLLFMSNERHMVRFPPQKANQHHKWLRMSGSTHSDRYVTVGDEREDRRLQTSCKGELGRWQKDSSAYLAERIVLDGVRSWDLMWWDIPSQARGSKQASDFCRYFSNHQMISQKREHTFLCSKWNMHWKNCKEGGLLKKKSWQQCEILYN